MNLAIISHGSLCCGLQWSAGLFQVITACTWSPSVVSIHVVDCALLEVDLNLLLPTPNETKLLVYC